MTDLSHTITPKSDQLNADDMIAGPKTIKITAVSAVPSSSEQPVAISFSGDDGKPYKPCKSMRRVMVALWGADGSKYVGRSMTLFRDPSVKWGGIEVGGIRISHMSDIDADVSMALTETRAKRSKYTVRKLTTAQAPKTELPKLDLAKATSSIELAGDLAAVDVFAEALKGYAWTREEKLQISKALADKRASFTGVVDL